MNKKPITVQTNRGPITFLRYFPNYFFFLGFDDINQLYRFIGSFPTDHIALSRALQIKTKNQKYLFEILHRNREAQPCIYRGEMVLGSPVNHSLQDYSLEEAMERRIFPVYIAPAVKRTKRLVAHKIKAEPVLIP